MEYRSVFDIQQANDHYLWLLVASLGLMIMFLGVYGFMERGAKLRSHLKQIFITLFGMLWLGAWLNTYLHFENLRDALRRGEYSIAEGRVTDFIPTPYGGKDRESFNVGERHFSYSSYDLTKGFNQTRDKGGPLREGLQVRISYVDDDTIVRIEVAK